MRTKTTKYYRHVVEVAGELQHDACARIGSVEHGVDSISVSRNLFLDLLEMAKKYVWHRGRCPRCEPPKESE